MTQKVDKTNNRNYEYHEIGRRRVQEGNVNKVKNTAERSHAVIDRKANRRIIKDEKDVGT